MLLIRVNRQRNTYNDASCDVQKSSQEISEVHAMCVEVHVCIYISMYDVKCVCTHMYAYVCIYIFMYVYVCICMYIHIYVRCQMCVYTYVCICMYIHIDVCICMYMCVHTYLCTMSNVCVHICTCTSKYNFIWESTLHVCDVIHLCARHN